jgi:hypothetical protein
MPVSWDHTVRLKEETSDPQGVPPHPHWRAGANAACVPCAGSTGATLGTLRLEGTQPEPEAMRASASARTVTTE